MTDPGIILKPWGREYLAHRNEAVAVWVLQIEAMHGTSLHAHPGKDTAFVLLRGLLQLELLRGAPFHWAGLNKLNVPRGRFHRLRSFSDDLVLLEIESPDDKRNIVRLEDGYGREDLPIEQATEPLSKDCLQLTGGGGLWKFAGCLLEVLDPRRLRSMMHKATEHDVIVTLRGGFENGLLQPGEAIDGATLRLLLERFPMLISDSQFLWICRE